MKIKNCPNDKCIYEIFNEYLKTITVLDYVHGQTPLPIELIENKFVYCPYCAVKLEFDEEKK
jgi:uncharacterized Zn-finger protein